MDKQANGKSNQWIDGTPKFLSCENNKTYKTEIIAGDWRPF